MAGVTFSGAFRVFFVPMPALTSWCFAAFPTGLHNCMRVVSITGHGALALLFASREFQGPVRLLCNGSVPHVGPYRGARMFGSAHGTISLLHSLRRQYRVPLCRMSARQALCVWTTFPHARALGILSSSAIGLSKCLKSSCLKWGLVRGGTCGWRSAAFGRELLDIDLGM
jgi:hypothetical protein